jgi:hypothetical protein
MSLEEKFFIFQERSQTIKSFPKVGFFCYFVLGSFYFFFLFILFIFYVFQKINTKQYIFFLEKEYNQE